MTEWKDVKQYILLHDDTIHEKSEFEENCYIDHSNINNTIYYIIWLPMPIDTNSWTQNAVAHVKMESDDYDELDLFRRLNGYKTPGPNKIIISYYPNDFDLPF